MLNIPLQLEFKTRRILTEGMSSRARTFWKQLHSIASRSIVDTNTANAPAEAAAKTNINFVIQTSIHQMEIQSFGDIESRATVHTFSVLRALA